MRWSGVVLCAVLVLCGCGDEPDVIIEQDVIEHVYETVYVEDTTPEVIIVEDTTPDIVYVTEEDTTPDVVQEFYSDAADLPVLLWNSEGEVPMPKKLRQLNSGVAITEIADDDAIGVDQDSSGDSMWILWKNVPLPTNYIGGLICSPDAGDPDNDVNITAGSCRGAADDCNLRLTSEITKQIDAVWAVGDDAGGLDSGSVATNTLYAIWLIKRSDTGVVDALFSTSFSAPTMPANYDKKRLIGAVKTDSSSDIIPFLQSGDEFVYLGNSGTSPPTDVNGAAVTDDTWTTVSMGSVPPLCMAHARASLYNTTSTDNSGYFALRTTPTTSWIFATGYYNSLQDTSGTFDATGAASDVLVDSSQQIDYLAGENSGTASITIKVMGFRMLTRNEPQ